MPRSSNGLYPMAYPAGTFSVSGGYTNIGTAANVGSVVMVQDINKNFAELNSSNNQITFTANGKILFTIMSDGRIAKGEAFTTTDEMSLEFWKMVSENFPVAWWKSLIKDQRPK